jgi:hypothetical protein
MRPCQLRGRRYLDLDELRAATSEPNARSFRLLCYVAFNAPIQSRRETVERLRKEKRTPSRLQGANGGDRRVVIATVFTGTITLNGAKYLDAAVKQLDSFCFSPIQALDLTVRAPHRPKVPGSLGTCCPLLPPQHDAQRSPLEPLTWARTSRYR